MKRKHLFILESEELILLSEIIKTEEKSGYVINISECGMDCDFTRSPSATGFRFVFTPKE